MATIGEIYKCYVCKNVVEAISEGAGILVCCGQDMKKLEDKVAPTDNAHYGHLEKLDDKTYKVTFNHVTLAEHHIELIEIISNDNKLIKRKYLNFDEAPTMTFNTDNEGFYSRLYCNIDEVYVTRY